MKVNAFEIFSVLLFKASNKKKKKKKHILWACLEFCLDLVFFLDMVLFFLLLLHLRVFGLDEFSKFGCWGSIELERVVVVDTVLDSTTASSRSC